MGLFGLLLTAASGGVLYADSCKNSYENTSNRERARREGKVTYSVNGSDYLTSTGEKVFIQGGKVYSLKQHGLVLYDMYKESYTEQNKKYVEEAKQQGKKYASFYRVYNPKTNTYNTRQVELSTMKPFELSYDSNPKAGGFEWIYYKTYLKNDGFVENVVSITKEEFEELGGYIPCGLTPTQYFYLQMEKREKERKKTLRGL